MKLKLIADWMNAPPTARKQADRADCFKDLLPVLQLSNLSSIFMLDFVAGETNFKMPDACRKELQDAWSEAISTNQYTLLLYDRDEDSMNGILKMIPELQKWKRDYLQFPAPYRTQSNVVLLKGPQ